MPALFFEYGNKYIKITKLVTDGLPVIYKYKYTHLAVKVKVLGSQLTSNS